MLQLVSLSCLNQLQPSRTVVVYLLQFIGTGYVGRSITSSWIRSFPSYGLVSASADSDKNGFGLPWSFNKCACCVSSGADCWSDNRKSVVLCPRPKPRERIRIYLSRWNYTTMDVSRIFGDQRIRMLSLCIVQCLLHQNINRSRWQCI